jgi:phosphatidate cytidylyltransferase
VHGFPVRKKFWDNRNSKPKKQNNPVGNLRVRTLTAILYVAVILSGLFHPGVFPFVFSMIVGLILWEFYGLMSHAGDIFPKRLAGTLGGMYLFLAGFLYAKAWVGSNIFLPYFLFLMYIFISEIYTRDPKPIHNWAFMLLGQVYCAASFTLLNFMIFHSAGVEPGDFTPLPGFALFVFVWLNDSGAYLVGSKFGHHHLFERISPKKSWEGFCGGLVFTLCASQVFAFYVPSISWFQWLGLSVVVVIFATWGDLAESLMKRTLGIKDSGTLLPGHGGMLDRFDSILLAIPALYVYWTLFIQS